MATRLDFTNQVFPHTAECRPTLKKGWRPYIGECVWCNKKAITHIPIFRPVGKYWPSELYCPNCVMEALVKFIRDASEYLEIEPALFLIYVAAEREAAA
jgi:hypothetical protein